MTSPTSIYGGNEIRLSIQKKDVINGKTSCKSV